MAGPPLAAYRISGSVTCRELARRKKPSVFAASSSARKFKVLRGAEVPVDE
jgi:hypothetical protein